MFFHVLSHVLSCFLMSSHVPSCSLMFSDVRSCPLMVSHVLSCSRMFSEVLSCSLMFSHVLWSSLMFSHVLTCYLFLLMSLHLLSHTCLLKISHVLCSLMCSLIWFLSCLFFPESCYGNVASLYFCMRLPIRKLSKRSLQFFLAEAGLQKIFEFFLNSKAALGWKKKMHRLEAKRNLTD